MLDVKMVRENLKAVEARLRDRGLALDFGEFLAADESRRRVLTEVEQLKHRRNTASEEVGRRKKAGQDAGPLITEMRDVGDQIKVLDGEVRVHEERMAAFLMTVPNLPHASVPVGPDSASNLEIRRWGAPRQFDFPPKPHWEIGEALGILDFERASRCSRVWEPGWSGHS
jgi:seryl-tRNA synthetase